jgi:hypothetical protein
MSIAAAEMAKRLTIPPDVQNVAALMDQQGGETVSRKARKPSDVFKMGIPGLRKEVPRR